MSVQTLDQATIALLARAAQSGGGRHAYRATDVAVRDAAKALADDARATRRRESQRERRALSIAQRAARDAALLTFNGYAPEDVCEHVRHTAECCRFGRMQAAWSDAPSRRVLREIARALFREDTEPAPATWRETVIAYRDARSITREVGAFALSRDDMRADARSRFYRRTSHLLATADYVNPAADASDVTQDAFLAALESRDGLTFGNMFRHVKAATTSAPWRYRRMGNRHSDNVRSWTWSDWEAWASSTGANRIAHSTVTEWQAYDAAKLAHEADAAYRRRVATRREVEATYLDSTRAAWFDLISQGMTVNRICKLLGRNPETVASELAGENASRLV